MLTATQRPAIEDRHILLAAQLVPSFEEGLSRLLYVVEHRRPCGVVLGQAGTGKSLLLNALNSELSTAQPAGGLCDPLLLNLRAAGKAELAWSLAAALGLSPNDRTSVELLWRAIEDRFAGAMMAGHAIVPIIDHLEQTDEDLQKAVSRCCRLAAEYESTIVLSACPPVSVGLAEVIRPYCDLRIELPPWTPQETSQFVTELMKGRPQFRIGDDAIDTIHVSAGGRLRDTVQVLRLALFAAHAQEQCQISAELVQTVVGEIWQPGHMTRPNTIPLPPAAVLATAQD